MKTKNALLALFAAVTLATAGCGGDIAQQILTNEQLRGRVLDVIAQHKDVALQAVDKMVAADSTRAVIVDHLLRNDSVAKQVIVSIATNPAAFDMVLGAAVRDTAMRAHVLTLVKGIQMASGGK